MTNRLQLESRLLTHTHLTMMLMMMMKPSKSCAILAEFQLQKQHNTTQERQRWRQSALPAQRQCGGSAVAAAKAADAEEGKSLRLLTGLASVWVSAVMLLIAPQGLR